MIKEVVIVGVGGGAIAWEGRVKTLFSYEMGQERYERRF